MKTRVISGLVGLVLLFTVVINGGILLNISILILSFIGLYEFNNAVKKINNLKPVNIANYFLTIGIFFITLTHEYEYFQLILFVYVIALLITFVINERVSLNDLGVTVLGGLYVPFFISHISLLRESKYIWLVFITAFATDTFAYFIGVKFGKRKLCPKLSPKKSIEGSIAGVVGSLIVTIAYAYIFKLNHIAILSILSIICSIMAQIGDLTASRIKRIAGIKDYGNIMPGHGGVLDRFDSILFTAPIVYYYITYFI
ncbi:phosphatidate cytidylyltransferase [Brassicibacter mesophilus]|uniref:phosphatidate cytidylyltransferase n=1 Tax=Brassicibacter mesophilus TaxID=745119 RepID=UPI003D1E767E